MQFNDLTTAQSTVVALIRAMRSMRDFIIGPVVTDDLKKMADAVEEGEITTGIVIAEKIVSAGRSILGGAIRYSVFDKKTAGGVVIGQASFLVCLKVIKAERYDHDLIDRFQVLVAELQNAVAIERNGDFSRRIAAYNTLFDFNEGVGAEQDRRDKARIEKDRAGQAAKKAQATGKSVKAPNAERMELLTARVVERKASADELRGLLA